MPVREREREREQEELHRLRCILTDKKTRIFEKDYATFCKTVDELVKLIEEPRPWLAGYDSGYMSPILCELVDLTCSWWHVESQSLMYAVEKLHDHLGKSWNKHIRTWPEQLIHNILILRNQSIGQSQCYYTCFPDVQHILEWVRSYTTKTHDQIVVSPGLTDWTRELFKSRTPPPIILTEKQSSYSKLYCELTDIDRGIYYNYDAFCKKLEDVVQILNEQPDLVEFDKSSRNPLLCVIAQIVTWLYEEETKFMKVAAEKLHHYIGKHVDWLRKDWVYLFIGGKSPINVDDENEFNITEDECKSHSNNTIWTGHSGRKSIFSGRIGDENTKMYCVNTATRAHIFDKGPEIVEWINELTKMNIKVRFKWHQSKSVRAK